MIISIASGKGGTGKTTVAVNLAMAIGSDVQLLDCDVEEPNSHLFINPVFEKTLTVTIPVPEVDEKKCNLCRKCGEICQFKAIIVIADTTVMTFPELCHSCGGCKKVCPENAIKETTRELGIIQKGYRNGLEFVHGKLRVGEAMSTPLIVKVRSFAKPDKFTIIDAPPGTSCPVIASMKDTDFILLVTEPTPFGLHDLKLAVGAVKILKIPCGLVINRSDMGDNKVKDYAKNEGIPVFLEIPFDRNIAEAYSRGDMIIEVIPELRDKFLNLYNQIKNIAE
ncbi:MAG: ATP-binding protein [Proteobacteria bacterium]|nr:ATP-binding protein [Pseudomonadota bacterium]MBU4286610.1 ATP-binding protein [Pseudomonadota bacterium]MBU4415565.1 ATP-binding protein [Pseudomonadota bacterium]MCG2829508.1 ATP-binding protein [Desulfobacteraceae bacterium]